MKYIPILFLTFSIICNCQTVNYKSDSLSIEIVSKNLCDQFDENSDNQAELQIKTVQEKILKNIKTKTTPINDLNALNYKITRELWKNCSKYKLKFYLLGNIFTRILDLDNTFNYLEEKELELEIKKLENSKKIQLLVITNDDLFPYSDISEYSIELGNNWKIGKYSQNGGIIIILNKNDKEIRLSTDDKLRKELTDSECEEIINDIKSYFKNQNYLEGLKIIIHEINEKI